MQKANEDLQILLRNGFPSHIHNDADIVVHNLMRNATYNNCFPISSGSFSTYIVKNEPVSFPYRIYYKDASTTNTFTGTQKLIHHCLYSRSCDGYVRQKHIMEIFNRNGIPSWCFPYIIKLCDEYVIEIIDSISNYIYDIDKNDLSVFISENIPAIKLGCSRMISYWDCYYRNGNIKEYKGYKLFNYFQTLFNDIPQANMVKN